jgi:hypothetical protein
MRSRKRCGTHEAICNGKKCPWPERSEVGPGSREGKHVRFGRRCTLHEVACQHVCVTGPGPARAFPNWLIAIAKSLRRWCRRGNVGPRFDVFDASCCFVFDARFALLYFDMYFEFLGSLSNTQLCDGCSHCSHMACFWFYGPCRSDALFFF